MTTEKRNKELVHPGIRVENLKHRMLDVIGSMRLVASKATTASLNHTEERVRMIVDDEVARKEMPLILDELESYNRAIARRYKLTLLALFLGWVTVICVDAYLWKLEGKSPWRAVVNALIVTSIVWGVTSIGSLFRRAPQNRVVHRPPVLAEFILFLIPQRDREHLIGDLEEEFHTVVLPKHGAFKAKAYYWWHAVTSVFPYIFRFIRRVLGLAALLRLIGR